jgi:protein-S-isoprenylcysteine O-methyltransferase Ste14
VVQLILATRMLSRGTGRPRRIQRKAGRGMTSRFRIATSIPRGATILSSSRPNGRPSYILDTIGTEQSSGGEPPPRSPGPAAVGTRGPTLRFNFSCRRRIRMLWLRTILFTLLVPGTVLGLVPFALAASTKGLRIDLGTAHLMGLTLLLPGIAIIISCFIDFVRRGRGTPAPYDPPRRLVVGGLYTYVRNPQYVGVILVAVGEAILCGRMLLFGYAAFLAVGYHLFVWCYEEPTLRRKFGEEYVQYCAAVSRWLPHRSSFRTRRK